MYQKPSPKLIVSGSEARRRLRDGARMFARAVCVTYGPRGNHVMLDRAAGLIATKDGVTVAREIDLADPVMNMACQTLKVACIKVNDEAGDGTTTAACITAAIIEEGVKLIEGGHNPIFLARGMQAAANAAVNAVLDIARPVDNPAQLERVAFIASNGNAEVAGNLAEAVMAVGKNGTITIEDGQGVETVLEYKDGMEVGRGACSVNFIREGTERILVNPLIAVIPATLATVEDVQDLMEVASQWPDNPLLVFCEALQGQALTMMCVNDAQGVMQCVAVPAPGFITRKKDYLGDIAALSGADLVDAGLGFDHKSWNPEWFGTVLKATITMKTTTLLAIDEASDSITERIEIIKREASSATSDYDIDRLNERVAALSSGLCVMKIGAHTEAELKAKRAAVEDALSAVRAALEEGVVPGGGTTYLAASEALLAALPDNDEPAFVSGWKVVAHALRAPLRTLSSNAGKNGDYLVDQVRDARPDLTCWVGWDGMADEVRDLYEDPMILDPQKVAISVIDASVSVASTLLTSEVAISGIQFR
jgi:chaperonin GroEL